MCQMTTTGLLRARPNINKTERLFQSCGGHWLGRRTGSRMGATLGTEEAGGQKKLTFINYQLPIIPRTLI